LARIVMVHGVGHQLGGPATCLATVTPALRDGVTLAGGPPINNDDVACGFYGDLFRKPGSRGGDLYPYDADDVEQGLETDLLMAWWREAARLDNGILGPDAAVRGAAGYVASRPLTIGVIRRALHAVSSSAFTGGISEHLLVFALKQVRQYFENHELRKAITGRVASAVAEDTQVVVGHSLGSVAAYEVLCAGRGAGNAAFVTLGSPLGLRNIVFDRLRPTPRDGLGAWPSGARSWTNVADTGDIVALVRELSTCFGPKVTDLTVSNGARMHDATAYLTAVETGSAIAAGLAE
jgi:hypothetical protein